MNTTWREAWRIVRDPATSVEELLSMPVDRYATLLAFVQGPTEASRHPEVVTRTITLLNENAAMKLSMQERNWDSTRWSSMHEKVARFPELTGEHIEMLAPRAHGEAASHLAAHPDVSPRALAMFLVKAQLESRLSANGRRQAQPLDELEAYTEKAPPRLRLAANIAMVLNNGRVATEDELQEALERFWELPGAGETLAVMRKEWHGTPEELLDAVEQLVAP